MPGVIIDTNGITTPTYDDYRNYLAENFRAIYGDDLYLEPDSQDGQLISIYALALYDTSQAIAAAYHSYPVGSAQGAGLSRMVPLNGIRRRPATFTQVDVCLVGVGGTLIRGGIVEDIYGNKYSLPASVTIPASGEIIVTAVASEPGAIRAAIGEVNKIATPTRGWQSVENLDATSPGEAVETDFELRIRQAVSTELPSLSVADGILGGVLNLPNVTKGILYENDTNVVDENGIPGHTISLVVEGGDVNDIAEMIRLKKTPGTGTFGDVLVTVYDRYGTPTVIKFFRPTDVYVTVDVYLKASSRYDGSLTDVIKNNLSAYVKQLPIGGDILINRLFAPVYAADFEARNRTFEVTAINAALAGEEPVPVDIPIDFNAQALLPILNINVIIG